MGGLVMKKCCHFYSNSIYWTNNFPKGYRKNYFFLKYTETGTPLKSNFSLNLFSKNLL